MIDTKNMTMRELLSLENRLRVKSLDEFYSKRVLLLFESERDSTKSVNDEILAAYTTYRQNLLIYQELLRCYNLFLEELSKDISLRVGDEVSLLRVIVLTKLIERGLVSFPQAFTHRFTSQNVYQDYPFPYNHMGLYVPIGHGLCRHQNAFVNDFLRKRDILCDNIICFASSGDFNGVVGKNNHMIGGIVDNGAYHFIDSYNNIYAFRKEREYYTASGHKGWLIPCYEESTRIFAEHLHYEDYPYLGYSPQMVKEVMQNAEDFLQDGGYTHFEEFKKAHEELLKRIYLLGIIELERNAEDEARKRRK